MTSTFAVVALAGLLVGCTGLGGARTTSGDFDAQTAGAAETRLRVGDQLQIRVDTGTTVAGGQPVQAFDVVIDEGGEISLPLAGSIGAAGLTQRGLAERIQAHYVPRYYVRCSVSVLVQTRFFYVGGEVRNPGRFGWTEDVTLLKAINTAGSYTDYANRRRIEVIRGKQKMIVDAEDLRRSPGNDVPIRPGDSIWVPRSIF